jgi:ribosomal protein S27E
MIPRNFCNKMSASSRGLKQVGRTRTAGTLFVRRYRCQDCGAATIVSGDLHDLQSVSERWFPPGSPEAAVLCCGCGRIRLSLIPIVLSRLATTPGPRQVN